MNVLLNIVTVLGRMLARFGRWWFTSIRGGGYPQLAAIVVTTVIFYFACIAPSMAINGTPRKATQQAVQAAALAPTATERIIIVTATSVPATATVAPTEMLPTETPAPPTVTAASTETTIPPTITPVPTEAGASPGVKAYLLAVQPHLGEIGKSLGEIGTLMSDPKPLDRDWKTNVAMDLGIIQYAHEEITKIDPVPPEAKKLHVAITDATGDCEAMTHPLATGIDTLSTKKLDEAVALMRSCNSKIKDAEPLLDELLQSQGVAQQQPTTPPVAARSQPTRAAAPVAAVAPTHSFDNNGDGKVTCADFSSQAQARQALAAGYKKLDSDHDGTPCESLP